MAMDINYLQEFIYKLDSLMVYKSVANDEVLTKLRKLSSTFIRKASYDEITVAYTEFTMTLIEKAEKFGINENIFQKYVALLFLNNANKFTIACECKNVPKYSTLYEMALFEMNVMSFLLEFDVEGLVSYAGQSTPLNYYVPINSYEHNSFSQLDMGASPEQLLDYLIWNYENIGLGVIGNCRMLKYDNEKGILPINNYDKVSFSEIVGYDLQKEQIINNTEAFLQGYDANNVLLVGHRGTGKSSCVKALANTYFDEGLRLIELTADQIPFIPKILGELRNRGKKFIVFIDDLSYQDDETNYKYLKFILEGTAEERPKNVLFYATSNRRNIIQETWADKAGDSISEEIHVTDSVNEKLSLADRFGLTVTFNTATKDEYIKMVIKMAKDANLTIPEDFLKEQSLKWEIEQKGISGRTAKQFINNIIWNIQKG